MRIVRRQERIFPALLGGREMTRREREVTEEKEILRILDEGKVLHLGLCDREIPYVLPMNYGYTYVDGRYTFYIHGAVKGYKYELIKNNSNAAFSIEANVKPFEGELPCQYGTSYESVCARGKAYILEDVEEKKKALSILMKTQTGKDFTFEDKMVSIVNVVRIDVTELTAKKRPLPAAMAGTEQ